MPVLGPIEVNCFTSRLFGIPPYCSISLMNSEPMFADGAGTMTKLGPIDTRDHNTAI